MCAYVRAWLGTNLASEGRFNRLQLEDITTVGILRSSVRSHGPRRERFLAERHDRNATAEFTKRTLPAIRVASGQRREFHRLLLRHRGR